MTPPFEVRRLPIDLLVPAPYNPRRILQQGDRAYRKLRASLEAFGLVEPLVWNENTGHVVGGHARLRILRDLGWDEVSVSVVHLSDAEEKSLNIVLNNLEAQGRFDSDKLADLLTELQPLPESAWTGFSPADLRALRLDPTEVLPEPEDEERVEVTLCTSKEVYETLAGPLEALIRQFDLVVHVKRAKEQNSARSVT